MIRQISIGALQRPPSPSQERRAGKPRHLRSKDILKAFTGPGVRLGENEQGVFVAVAQMSKGHDDVTFFLIASGGDPAAVKATIEGIFLSEGAAPVDTAPGELDMRQLADGYFTGSWFVCEEEGLSFAFLADSGYEMALTEQEALTTFIKIFKSFKEGRSACR